MSWWQSTRRRMIAKVYRRLIAGHDRFIAPYKQDLFRGLRGSVLEIGPGPGSNLPYLKQVEHWVGIEPNRFMHPLIQGQLESQEIDGTILEGEAEELPFEDQTFDAVVGTLVLCSVKRPDQVLSEVLRVLRPGGQYCFIEHVGAPQGTSLRRWQTRVKPLWRCFGDGCCPDRDTQETLARTGFERLDYQEFRAPRGTLPSIVSPHISGSAWRRD